MVLVPFFAVDFFKAAAYKGREDLVSVVIPKTAKAQEIAERAFEGCVRLTDVVLPEGVIFIGERAFADCRSLTEVSVPEGVILIGDGAFKNCGSLTDVVLSGTVRIIGDGAFAGCRSLKGIDIPDGIKLIHTNTFKDCSGLTSVTIPPSVNVIKNGAFAGCSGLTSITLPKEIRVIAKDAFADCCNLTEIFYLGRRFDNLYDFAKYAQRCSVSYSCEADVLYKNAVRRIAAGDSEKGYAMLDKALELNDSKLCSFIGLQYLIADSYMSKALEALHKGADEFNDSTCQYILGVVYYLGLDGEEPDIMKAYEYWSRSAEQKNRFALYKLGYEDPVKLDLLEMAEEFDDFTAASIYAMIGMIYLHGETESAGVKEEVFREFYDNCMVIEEDAEKAVHYFKLAADKGLSSAKFYLGVIYYEGAEGVVERDRAKAAQLISEAACEGYGKAIEFLAEHFGDDEYE